MAHEPRLWLTEADLMAVLGATERDGENEEDDVIRYALRRACKHFESRCSRRFLHPGSAKTPVIEELVLDCAGSTNRLPVPNGPIRRIQSVEILGEGSAAAGTESQLFDGSATVAFRNGQNGAAILVRRTPWPRGIAVVRFKGELGYLPDEIPADLRGAAAYFAGKIYQNRDLVGKASLESNGQTVEIEEDLPEDVLAVIEEYSDAGAGATFG